VLGIGNTLLSDEALGPKAIERFGAAYRASDQVRIIDGGTSAMELLDQVAGCDLLLVVDALLTGRAPGTTVRLAGEQVPVFFRSKLSQHQVGLSDLLASLDFAGQMPARTVVLGIEPASMGLGLELTPTVQAQMPLLVDLIATELLKAGIAVAPRGAGM
jgi:hydrogenase maturation protease